MLIALASAMLAAILVRKSGAFFYQNFAPEVVYAACGHGFVHPGRIPAVLEDFVLLRTTTFDCSRLGAVANLNPPGIFASLQLYLSYAAIFFWKAPVLDVRDLWPLLAFMAGAYAAGVYALLRLFFPLPQAIAGGILVTVSPVALSLITQLRDYSKAPFFVWALVFLVLAIRTDKWRSAIGWAALAGLAVGIGRGFRTDVLVLLVIGCAALLAAIDIRAFLRRGTAALALVSVAILSSWPIQSLQVPSSAGQLVLQGLSDPFEAFLGLTPAPYSFGAKYSDELALSSIAAAERPSRPDWDSKEPLPFYEVSQSMRYSTESALRWLPLFVGDLATQGLKSVAWIVAMPAVTSHDRPPDPANPVRSGSSASRLLFFVYDVIGRAWLIPVALAGLILFFWREAVLRPKTVLAIAVLLGLSAAYTVVQFSTRHIFHLEFLWLIALLSIPTAIIERRKLRTVTRWFPLTVLSLLALTLATYVGLLAYQQNALRQTFTELLALPRQAVEAAWAIDVESGERRGRFVVPVPPDRALIVKATPDSMTTEIPVMGLQWDVRAEADRLLLGITGCPAGTYTARIAYTVREGAWQPFDHEISVNVSGEAGTTHVLFPAFYRPTQNFSMISFNPLPEGCSLKLERIEGDTVLPPVMSAVLRPGWQEERLYRGFGGF